MEAAVDVYPSGQGARQESIYAVERSDLQRQSQRRRHFLLVGRDLLRDSHCRGFNDCAFFYPTLNHLTSTFTFAITPLRNSSRRIIRLHLLSPAFPLQPFLPPLSSHSIVPNTKSPYIASHVCSGRHTASLHVLRQLQRV